MLEVVDDDTYARTAEEDIKGFCDRLLSWGRKEVTVRTYAQVLGKLTRILRSKGLETDPRTMTEDDVYSLFLGMDKAPSTKERYLSVLQQYCRYYGNNMRIDLLLNQETPCTKWIADGDIPRLIRACRTDAERVMIHLGADYGLRRGEIASLSLCDLDWTAGTMTVHGKGHGEKGKERTVPLMEDDLLLYRVWRDRVEHTHAPEDPLLVHRGGRYSPPYLGNIVKGIMKRAGVDGTCHSLRREFITSAYHASGDEGLVHIMQIVGHEDLRETMRYIKREPARMREVMTARRFYISSNAYE